MSMHSFCLLFFFSLRFQCRYHGQPVIVRVIGWRDPSIDLIFLREIQYLTVPRPQTLKGHFLAQASFVIAAMHLYLSPQKSIL